MNLSSPYSGPREVKYLFIDGGCLRKTLEALSERYFPGSKIELDYNKLAGNFTKVFYYDALPVKELGETEADYTTRIQAQETLLNHIRSFNRYHVYEGDARRRPKRGLEQKKVDVMIAVDMLTHTVRRNMHTATLLTGDVDFKPLVDALVQEGMFITLWYPRDATSRELITAADARGEFDIRTAYNKATKEFQKRFSLPHTFSSTKDISNGILQTSWDDVHKGTVELYQVGEEYLLVFVEGLNAGYYFHIRHRDFDLIRRFAEDIFGLSVPGLYESHSVMQDKPKTKI